MINIRLSLHSPEEQAALSRSLGQHSRLRVLSAPVIIESLKALKLSGIETNIVLLELTDSEDTNMFLFNNIRANFDDVKLIVISENDDERFVKHLFELGAKAFLRKKASTQELLFCIQEVADNNLYLCSELSLQILRMVVGTTRPNNEPLDVTLTSREREVLYLIAEGYTNVEIADKLFSSRRTIEGHRYNLLNKLGVKNTAQLIREAFKKGLLAVEA
ncbi:LuxR C-terminal-related transcriptional regulator [Desertivirga arenae]|uniref:LuxR C-terminal-related transcriptional regulator n=1 Tax=Desertivirga arenae TaxID=2810309 RepID=UPI001A96D14D|nr:response regulator transcription factor [Pedobacter sp. SYSU D00823]